MSTENNKQKIENIKKLIENFCDANLNKIYKACIMRFFSNEQNNDTQ
jgi:hypothetical protein